jgi:rhomboid family GlyGly-CTERM serine protease
VKSLSAQAPRVTVTIVILAIATAVSPMLQRALVLDRDAVMHGQLWRVATGNLVHFSSSHLLCDLFVVAIAGVFLERRHWPVAAIVGGSGIAVGVAVLRFEPTVTIYGGLSGIACALVVIVALESAGASGLTRATGVAFLMVLATKLWWEWTSGSFVFVSAAGIRPVPIAHLAGSGAGVVAWLRRHWVGRLIAAVRGSATALSPAPARGPGSRS